MENVPGARGYRAALAAFVAPGGACLAAVLALVALARHWNDVAPVEGVGVTKPVMVPVAAVGVLLAAGALLLVGSPRGAAGRGTGRLLAAATTALGLLVLGQYAADLAAGPLPGMPGGGWVQRPGATTGLGFVFLGASLLALGMRDGRTRSRAGFGAAATLVAALTGLVGHAYGAGVLYGLNRWGGMATSTAVALGVLALGALFAEPSRGVAAVSVSDSAGGHLLRRLTPAALLAPPLFGWLVLEAQEHGLVNAAFGAAVLVVSLMVLLVGLIVHQATALHAADAERERLLVRERVARAQVTRILESITDAFFAVDPEWRFSYVNREAERLLQRPREELLGRSLWVEFSDAVGTTFHREYHRAMAERTTVQFEEYYPPLGIWADVHVYPAPDGLSVFFRDVTAGKLAEERLRESEERFRALAENATMGIFVLDEESTIEFANPAVERIFGYTVPEMLGRPLDMLMPERQRPLYYAWMRRYLATGRRSIPWEGVELAGLTKEGVVIPLEISIGEFVREGRRYFTGITRDITERKQAEEALRESEERYRLLVDMVPQHIWTTDADGYHTYFSRRWYEFTGTTPEQAGEGWLGRLHPDDRERVVARWRESLRTGARYSIEHRIRKTTGEYCWFWGQAVPQRNEAGEIVRWFGTLTDISERKRLDEERERFLRREQEARAEAERRREELERVTESRARLMRGFTHDVKNPLGAADGYAQLLADGIMGELSGKQRESVERIRRSIQTSLRLINELLELARAEAGQIELEPVPTDVAELAREAAEDFRAQAAAAGLELDVRAAEALPAEIDPTRVRQILSNLLSNAVKYTPEGRITVEADFRSDGGPRGADCIAIHVTDTGPGIPPEKREPIFQEFTRLDPEAQHGAGVGLAISRRIARLIGGDITVESEVGRGSTFTLWLPPADPDRTG